MSNAPTCRPAAPWISSAFRQPGLAVGTTATGFRLRHVTRQPTQWLYNQRYQTLAGRGGEAQCLEPVAINLGDAAARGVATGDPVILEDSCGRCLASVLLGLSVRPVVVVMPTGVWRQLNAAAAYLDRGGNPNMLTSHRAISALAQASAASSLLLTLRRAG